MKQEIMDQMKQWVQEAGAYIRENMTQTRTVKIKTSRTDLVTDLDERVQTLLIKKITTAFPNDRILAEEQGRDQLPDLAGAVWIIDPIDGTLNFVAERENFCVMVAYYVDGIGQGAVIYDVMRDEMYWGGPAFGVYCNDQQLPQPAALALDEGLIGMNGYMYGENLLSAKEIGKRTLGIRVNGCAGSEFIALLKGQRVGYLSKLSPWDYAAGCVLIAQFGFQASTLTGDALPLMQRDYFIAASTPAYAEIQADFFAKNKTELATLAATNEC